MGKTATFNKRAAEIAGMVCTMETNGTDEAIAEAKADSTTDPDYLVWLQQEDLTVTIPTKTAKVKTTADEWESEGTISIQGNDWGFFGKHVKAWLEENQITYDQF